MRERGNSVGDGAGASSHAEAVKQETCPVKNPWLRRIGAATFLFFLVKGLLWLLVPAAVVAWRAMAE